MNDYEQKDELGWDTLAVIALCLIAAIVSFIGIFSK